MPTSAGRCAPFRPNESCKEPPLTRATVLVVGSLHYDIMVETDHLPRKDETAVGHRWYPKFGGKGGNQAVSAALHGAAVRFLGAVGTDDFGRFLAAGLEAAKVDLRFLRQVEDAGSGLSVALQDSAGDYAATIVSGANQRIDPHWLQDSALWADVGLLVLQNEAPEQVNIAAAAQARHRAVPVILNAAPSRPLSAALRRDVDILVVNAVEAEMMGAAPVASLASAAEAARTLAADAASVIVTAAARGLAVCEAGKASYQIPATPVRMVSSHGAGDAFIGALAAALVAGSSLRASCEAASRAAAAHVSQARA
ncbi:MAG: ribokinase [Tabrizicola sp.]|nr:ribokinase [Tabrizicola sp.]